MLGLWGERGWGRGKRGNTYLASGELWTCRSLFGSKTTINAKIKKGFHGNHGSLCGGASLNSVLKKIQGEIKG